MQDFAFQKYVTTYPDLYQDITDSGIDLSQFAESKLAASTIDGKNYYFAEKGALGTVKECQLIMTDENGAII